MSSIPHIQFCIDGAAPYLLVRPEIIASVQEWLTAHEIFHRSDEGIIELDHVQVTDSIEFGIGAQPEDLLAPIRRMAGEKGWELKEPELSDALGRGRAPLRVDSAGVIRVGDTRVRLDSVVVAYHDGSNPEEIVEQFPALKLDQVYGALYFYLRYRASVDKQLATHHTQEDQHRERALGEGKHKELRRRWRQRIARREMNDAPTTH